MGKHIDDYTLEEMSLCYEFAGYAITMILPGIDAEQLKNDLSDLIRDGDAPTIEQAYVELERERANG